MPCRCDDMLENERRDAADQATRAGCDMRTVLRRNGLESELTEETRQWIAKHDAEDAARIREATERKIRKQARLRALNKLTLEERRVLGL